MPPYFDENFEATLIRGPLKGTGFNWSPASYSDVSPPATWPDASIVVPNVHCPDDRQLFGSSQCVAGAEVGALAIDLSTLTVQSLGAPPGFVPLFYPTLVHKGVPLTVNLGESIYSIFAFDPEPDFMQMSISWLPGEYGSYHDSCYVDSATGRRIGCGKAVLNHPRSSLEIVTDTPWGLRDGVPDVTHVVYADPLTGMLVATHASYPLDASGGGDAPVGQTWLMPPHPFAAFSGLASGSNIPTTLPSTGIRPDADLLQPFNWLEYVPDDGEPVYDGEPDNLAKFTLWPYREINNITADFGTDLGLYGFFRAGLSIRVMFFWTDEPTNAELTIGPMRHHLRRIRGGRTGEHEYE